jgi:hypothetical protein
LQQLTDQHAFVDKIDRAVEGEHLPVMKIQIIRCADRGLNLMVSKILDKETKLAGCRHALPVHNGDIGQFAAIATPLIIDAQERFERVRAHFEWGHGIALLEFLHQWRF